MQEFAIKGVPASRWKEYKELVLEELKTNPRAFASSYQEEVIRKNYEWKKELQEKNSKFLFLLYNNRLVGMAKIEFQQKQNKKHIAEVHRVYVQKKFRGKGAGNLLMMEVLKQARKRKEVKKVELKVNLQQKAAIRLYEGIGFRIVGKLKKELRVNGRYYNEYIMEYIL